MEVLYRIFASPFEVTQFWDSDRYLAMGMRAGDTIGHLYKYCPEHVRKYQPKDGDDWYFEVQDGEDGQTVGDFLPRLLPTRGNIALLNDACIRASECLSAVLEKEPVAVGYADDEPLFSNVVPYLGEGEMHIRNEAYRDELWKVLAQDWGLALPPSNRFGIDPVIVSHRPGLPCAAAMVRSVLPIVETLFGELDSVDQVLSQVDGRAYDVMTYRRPDGQALVQKYDVTEIYGRRDLDWKHFEFRER